MSETKPGRVYIAERLGGGDYRKGIALFDAKLAEARKLWLQMDQRKSLAALIVGALAVAPVFAAFALHGRPMIWWIAVVAPLLALLHGAVLSWASVECLVRFDRAPYVIAWLAPAWLGRIMLWRFAIPPIDGAGAFDGLDAREAIAKADGAELDPSLFDDRLWPLCFSADDRDRKRAAWREYGYRGGVITVHSVDRAQISDQFVAEVTIVGSVAASEAALDVSVDADPSRPAEATATSRKRDTHRSRHHIQALPDSVRGKWIEQAIALSNYEKSSDAYQLVEAVLSALWDILHSPNWQKAGVSDSMICREVHRRVLAGELGVRSTELRPGKESDTPASWLGKLLRGDKDYPFAVEAARVIANG